MEGAAGPAGGITYAVIGYVGWVPRSLRAGLVAQAFTARYWFAHGPVFRGASPLVIADPVLLKVERSAGGKSKRVPSNPSYNSLSWRVGKPNAFNSGSNPKPNSRRIAPRVSLFLLSIPHITG